MVQRRPFPLLAERPASLEGVILAFHWDLERLHALSLPEREVPTSTLDWHLSLPFWAAGAPVLGVPRRCGIRAECTSGAVGADLRYPLDAYVGAEGRLILLDGVHRLLKARVEGRSTLRVRVLEADAFDAIAVPVQE